MNELQPFRVFTGPFWPHSGNRLWGQEGRPGRRLLPWSRQEVGSGHLLCGLREEDSLSLEQLGGSGEPLQGLSWHQTGRLGA